MQDDELVVKLATLELKRWDECIQLTIDTLNESIKKGITIEKIIELLKSYDWIPLEEMSEQGQQFYKNHAKKVLELIEQHHKEKEK